MGRNAKQGARARQQVRHTNWVDYRTGEPLDSDMEERRQSTVLELFERYSEYALSVAGVEIRKRGLFRWRDEIRQLALITLWKAAQGKDKYPQIPFKIFCSICVKRKILNWIRSTFYLWIQKKFRSLEQLLGDNQAGCVGSVAIKPNRVEMIEYIHWLLKGLSQQQHRAVTLHYLNGLTFDEVAQVMNISWTKAQRITSTAIARLRRQFVAGGYEVTR